VCAAGVSNNCACSSSAEAQRNVPFAGFALLGIGAFLLRRRRR
jgi:MYXO-CTERM domain-containing protein